MVTLFKDRSLINLENFESVYTINIKSYTSLNKEREPLFIERKSKIKLRQVIDNSKIANIYSLTETEENSNNEEFNKFFKKFSVLSFITEELHIERNLGGKINSLTNMNQIEKKWKFWKEKKLYDFLPVLEEQEKFVASFESGLSYLKENIKNELQYVTLFPEFYQFKDYISSAKEYTSLFIFDSRLIRGVAIKYKLYISDISQEQFSQNLKIYLKSEITNKKELEELLKNMENQYQDITNYQFDINVFYNIDKSSGEIFSAKMELIEKIMDGHDYKCSIDLDGEKKELKNSKIYKVYKGEKYTKEEWGKLEQILFEEYIKNIKKIVYFMSNYYLIKECV